MSSLVRTDWLQAQLGSPDLVILDATYFLPTEAADARANFDAQRIPGACFFDHDEVADQDTDLPHMVPSTGRFERLAGALGVDPASRVVFYDQKGVFSAARGWWLFRLFGHERVFVLDGGLPKWLAQGHPVEQGRAPAPTAAQYRATLRSGLLRGSEIC